MRRFLCFALFAFIIIGCQKFRDELNALQKQIDLLTDRVDQLNANINSFSEIVREIQAGGYVKECVEVVDGGKSIGWRLVLSDGREIMLYNGKDGQDGQDGHTPIIGVRQDTDGLWYWTLDSVWLTDATGAKIRASGIDGQNGQDGKDAIAPQLKIENDYWYISIDGGQTWTQLEKAKGENGTDGQDGQDGDAFFQSVDVSNTEYVALTLSDGTVIRIPTWAAFEALRNLVNQMNTNLTALQEIVTALQNNDYVTSVAPYYENGVQLGYILTFSKSGSVIIYHGKDGKDGADGQDGQNGHDGLDGHTPVIGVRQDIDGLWYWTLDGEWLTDAGGEKVSASGIDGQNGKDAIAPQLKIENDYWYISTDDGETWTQLGKAKGEDGADGQDGQDGQDGADGDSFFQSVDVSSADYVVLTLADGTEIKIPTWKAFEELSERVAQINTNLASLQQIVTALQDNDYVQSVTPYIEGGVQKGYIISFTKSGSVIIFHGKDGTNGTNGQDGHTPVIGVRQFTDGQWYWTLDGEWLTDDTGEKVRANGIDGQNGQDGQDGQNGQDAIAPQLKIENDYWYISTDGGETWTQLGKAKGDDGTNGADGQDGDSFFRSVDISNPAYILLVLADGTEIRLNRHMAVSLNLSVPDDIPISSNEVIPIGYTVEGTTSPKTIVTASSDGNYKVRVVRSSATAGTIYVTCPAVYVDGFINVLLNDGYGNTDLKVLNFYERSLTLAEGLNYTIGYAGGTINIPVQYNFDYDLQLVDDAGSWITIVQTKAAVQSGTIQLSVAENTATTARSGQINVVPTNNPTNIYQTITVQQDRAPILIESISLDPSTWTLREGGTVGLTATISPSTADNQTLNWTTSSASVATVSSSGVVTGVAKGTATITATATDGSGKSATCAITVIDAYVDLGLSVEWATCNICENGLAGSPIEYGDYYAWGETETKDDYSWLTYKYGTSTTSLTKYNNDSSKGTMDNLTELQMSDDVAHAKLGGSLRIPTDEMWIELSTQCTWTWINLNGVNGMLVSASNGNSIFLPAAGYRNDTDIINVGAYGYYWSSSLDTDNPNNAWNMSFYSVSVNRNNYSRFRGRAIRPVYDDRIHPQSVSLNKSTLSMFVGNSKQLIATILPANVTTKTITWSSSTTRVATVDTEGHVTAVASGKSIITATTDDGKLTAQCEVRVIPEGAVDLGLSVFWATCNLGEEGFVNSPEEYGDYYAWGETATKANYSWGTYKFGTSSSGPFSKYNTLSEYGTVDNKTTLEMSDDVARKKLGSRWRMPTGDEFLELKNNCTVEWTTLNGVNGRKFTSKITGYTGKSIFLPAAGYKGGVISTPFYDASRGYYWSSSLYTGLTYNAYFILFDSQNTNMTSYQRCDGYSIRPVSD